MESESAPALMSLVTNSVLQPPFSPQEYHLPDGLCCGIVI